jgi:hypothetical protein
LTDLIYVGTIHDVIDYFHQQHLMSSDYSTKLNQKGYKKIPGFEYADNKDMIESLYVLTKQLQQLESVKLFGPRLHLTMEST